ncbi:MAG TPA: hypothetical protein VKS60_04635 [Stellaceae bacterium]|nr:hypothetical protein [Stellaceae bacterium]
MPDFAWLQRFGRWRAALLAAVMLLGGIGALEAAAELAPLKTVQSGAVAYLDASKTKAIEAFAAGRLLNGGISFLKSVELTPFGVGAAPLQALEPIDDLAKQFSDVMLVSIAAILVQQLLLSIGTTVGLTILLPIGCGLWLLADFGGDNQFAERLARLGRGIVLLALFIRLVVPVAAWADEALTRHFLAPDLDRAIGAMRMAGNKIAQREEPASGAVQNGASGPAGSTWQSLVTGIDSLKSSTERIAGNIPDVGTISKDLEEMPNEIVTAIEIFVVQTILAPLSVAWLLYTGLRQIVPAPHTAELAAIRRLAVAIGRRGGA